MQGATQQVAPAAALPAPLASAVEAAAAEASTLQSQEIAAIRRAVQAAGGNIARAARQLGVARNTVYRKLKGG
jgi:transcriptional regulator of acetoin/glycerol metabolism